MSILEITGLTKRFGGLTAVSDYSLSVEKNEIFSIMGPNGAGKTTIFNLITGIYVPTEGLIKYNGEVINKLKPHRIVKKGIARTFQNIRLFKKLTTLENVMTGYHCRTTADVFSIVLRPKFVNNEERETVKKCEQLLDYMGILDLRDTPAGSLPYGHQRLLEIARALATEPQILLLDEPAAGMNMEEKKALVDCIYRIRKDYNLTILLVEHNMDVIMNISDKISVLNYGKLLAEGVPEEIKRHPEVIEAYLGREDSEDSYENTGN